MDIIWSKRKRSITEKLCFQQLAKIKHRLPEKLEFSQECVFCITVWLQVLSINWPRRRTTSNRGLSNDKPLNKWKRQIVHGPGEDIKIYTTLQIRKKSQPEASGRKLYGSPLCLYTLRLWDTIDLRPATLCLKKRHWQHMQEFKLLHMKRATEVKKSNSR